MADKNKQDEFIRSILDKLRELNILLEKGPEHELNIKMDVKHFAVYEKGEVKSLNVEHYPEIRVNIHKWVRIKKEDFEE